ncbi:hypothetical protein CRG98_010054 [Punica granatum]|uniref:Uncharacterized protein n=1 Tax=Punica granatum TaxID=22663 RepID=A0A2I0KM55_PUNGR|nr:hypothetical protein CRG98_010054 [Punica granatum]
MLVGCWAERTAEPNRAVIRAGLGRTEWDLGRVLPDFDKKKEIMGSRVSEWSRQTRLEWKRLERELAGSCGSSGWPRLTTMLRAFERRPKVVEGSSDPACICFDPAKTIRPG